MSDQTIRLLIAGSLLLHGLGHFGAIMALVVQGRVKDTGKWKRARSWLFPTLAEPAATTIAIIFWGLSLIGFVAASMSFWGVLLPGDIWRQLALVSAFISFTGIMLFLGNWPWFNTIAAQVMNIAVIMTQVWLHWPPVDMFGK